MVRSCCVSGYYTTYDVSVMLSSSPPRAPFCFRQSNPNHFSVLYGSQVISVHLFEPCTVTYRPVAVAESSDGVNSDVEGITARVTYRSTLSGAPRGLYGAVLMPAVALSLKHFVSNIIPLAVDGGPME